MMKKLSVFIVSSLLLFVFSAKAMAAEETLENNSGLVTGQITDAEKQILPGASIIVEGMHAGVTSDINGFYTIANLKPGTYTLKVSYVGYSPKEMTVTIANGKVLTRDVVLD